MLAKKRSRAYKLLIKILVTLGFALCITGLIYLIFFSSLFKIESLNISGRELAPDLDIGGIGDNIIFWNLDEDDLPFVVENISYQKKYLKRTIDIVFHEREKYLIWCYSQDAKCYWIDKNGLIFSSAPDLKGPLIFKIVRDKEEPSLEIGEKVLPEDMYKNLVAAFEFLEKLDLPANEFIIEDISRREAIAKILGGKEIYFSLVENPDFGISVVESLKESGDWDVIRYLDLRVRDRAYYSL